MRLTWRGLGWKGALLGYTVGDEGLNIGEPSWKAVRLGEVMELRGEGEGSGAAGGALPTVVQDTTLFDNISTIAR